MSSASRRPRPKIVILVIPALLVVAAVAATLPGASPPAVADAADAVVTAPEEPQKLGVSFTDVAPTWALTADTVPRDAASDIVAVAQRTVYTTGYTFPATQDLRLSKYVDGALRWQRTYDGPAHGDDCGMAVAARGKAIYTAGFRTTKSGTLDVLLIRWNSSGDRVWTRTYDKGGGDDSANDVAVDGDGNVVVVGASEPTAGADPDWVVIGYRPDGTRRYVRRYDGPSHLGDVAGRLAIDGARRVYVAGYSTSAKNDRDALVRKFSATGAVLWTKRFDGTAHAQDGAYSLRLRPGGGVYVCGETGSVGTGTDGLLLAYTSAGSRVLTVRDPGFLPDMKPQAFYDLEVMPGGDVICGGFDQLAASMDGYMAIYSPSGEMHGKMWEPRSDWRDAIISLAKDSQGGVYLTGTLGTGATSSQIWTMRIREGGTSWVSTWPASPATSHESTATAVYGVNAYVAGFDGQYDEVTLGHVY